jgi:hypothetical protein
MAIQHNELAQYRHYQQAETRVIDGRPVRFRDVCVKEIHMADVEDPDLWVASPIYDWQQTAPGKFVMEHAVQEPYWISSVDYASYGTVYKIMARLSEQNETFWRLLCSGKQ